MTKCSRLTASLLAAGAVAALSLSGCGLIGNDKQVLEVDDAAEKTTGTVELVVTSDPNGWVVDTDQGPQSLDTIGKTIEDSNLHNQGVPLRGVSVEVYRIEGLSSTDPSDTFLIEEVERALAKDGGSVALRGYDLEPVTEAVTNSNGEVSFSDLDVGVYYVSQSDGGDDEMYPFVMSIPTFNEDEDEWSYDLYIKR